MARCQSAFGAILLLLLATSRRSADSRRNENRRSRRPVPQLCVRHRSRVRRVRPRRPHAADLSLHVREGTARGRRRHAGRAVRLPLTFGFFDFTPLDVLSEGIPTRVDSFSLVPGLELDYLLPDDWHLIPYARAGVSVASSSVDGWLYGLGVRRRARRRLARLGQLRAHAKSTLGRRLPSGPAATISSRACARDSI